MGENQKNLVKIYLDLEKQLETATGHEAELIKAKMDGMEIAHNTYRNVHYNAFEYLIDEYKSWIRQ